MTNMIRVLLADDHPLVRAGLRATLLAAPEISLVGEAVSHWEVLRLCPMLAPHVLLLDLNMPGPPPLETVAQLRLTCPQVRIVALTAFDDDVYVRSLIAAGASGYVLKDEAPDLVVAAVRCVMAGSTWFSTSVLTKLVQEPQEEEVYGPGPILTDRERQLLQLLIHGWDNARIARQVALGEQTIRNYLSRLYDKINVGSRAEAASWAREHYPELATDVPQPVAELAAT